MRVEFISHSCFAVDYDNALIVFDYSKDSDDNRLARMIAAKGDKPLYFIVSHFHEDHFNPQIAEVPGARLLVSYDTAKRRHIHRDIATAILHPGEDYQDDALSLHAYRSTDVGISSLVTLPDGTTIYHAGDNNNWYFPEDEQDHIHCSLSEMEGLFISTVCEISKEHPSIDHVMFPLDMRLGSQAARGAFQWLRYVKTCHFYPMHCWERWDEVSELIENLRPLFPEVDFIDFNPRFSTSQKSL